MIWPVLYKIDTQGKNTSHYKIKIPEIMCWKEKVIKQCMFKFSWDFDFVLKICFASL